MVTQKDCTTVAIITGLVFFSGVAGYVYMEKCQKEKNCEEGGTLVANVDNGKVSETSKTVKDQREKVNTGNIELDNLINKIKRFSVFSPRTIPEIQKQVKSVHSILNKVKLAKEEDELDYNKQLKLAEASQHAMLNQFSKLEIELPDDDGAKNIFKVNSEKIKKIVKAYLDEIKLKVEEENV